MQLLPADYVFCGLAIVMALVGLFRGFSGTIAFAAAAAVAVLVGKFGWPFSAAYIEQPWARGLAVLAGVLVVFGFVRLIVKKLVNGLLAQPSDALFGLLVGLVLAAVLLWAWAQSGLYLDYSTLATEVAKHV